MRSLWVTRGQMEKFKKFPKIAHAKTLKKSTCYINESENKQKPELKYDLMTKADR